MKTFKDTNELLKAFHRFQRLNIASILPNITPMEFRLLAAVVEVGEMQGNPDVTVSAACRTMCASGAAVSRLLKILEEKELIYREVDTKDRRNTYIRITEKGRKVYDEVSEIMAGLINAILERAGKGDVDKMVEILSRIYTIAEEEIAQRKRN